MENSLIYLIIFVRFSPISFCRDDIIIAEDTVKKLEEEVIWFSLSD